MLRALVGLAVLLTFPATAQEQAPAAPAAPRRCLLGVTLQNYPHAVVDAVTPGSPADRAGVKRGDIILGVNGMMVVGPAKVLEEVRRTNCGDEVALTVMNMTNPSPRVLKMILDTEGPPDSPLASDDCSRFSLAGIRLGMTLRDARAACPNLRSDGSGPAGPKLICPGENGALDTFVGVNGADDDAYTTFLGRSGYTPGTTVTELRNALIQKLGPPTSELRADDAIAFRPFAGALSMTWEDPRCNVRVMLAGISRNPKTGKPLDNPELTMIMKLIHEQELVPRLDSSQKAVDAVK